MPIRRCKVIFFLLFTVNLYGQYDTKGLTISENTDQWFIDQIGIQKTGLLTGSYFPLNIESSNSYPFFLNRDWIKGKIKFQNQVFESVNLRYHIEEDLVLTNDPTKIEQYNEPILLNSNQIDWFELEGHIFRKFTPKVIGSKSGFFEVIYDGDQISLLSKRRKRLTVVEGSLEYVNEDLFILITDEKDYIIKNRGAWIKVFKDYKQEIKKAISSLSINQFKKAKYEHLVILAKSTNDILNSSK